MDKPLPAAFRLLRNGVDRSVDSVASAPGSTRSAQGHLPPKNWLKVTEQGSLGYVKVRFESPGHHPASHAAQLVQRSYLLVERLDIAAHPVQGDKNLMSKELAIPHRDLRLLDPEVCGASTGFWMNILRAMSGSACYKQVPMAYPSAILVREKAMLIHLESIRMVISKDAVYVLTIPNATDRHVGMLPSPDAAFIRDLVLCITEEADAGKLTLAR